VVKTWLVAISQISVAAVAGFQRPSKFGVDDRQHGVAIAKKRTQGLILRMRVRCRVSGCISLRCQYPLRDCCGIAALSRTEA
jgi:hypothetical protein